MMDEDHDIFTSLSKMSSLLAHEMRNPLAAAMGQAELLEAVLPDGAVREKIQNILSELSRLDRLSQSLLEFVHSRQVDRRDHACLDLLLEVKAMVNDPRLQIMVSKMPERWSFDITMLACAVKNIIANALLFSDPSMPVEATLTQQDDHFMITVRDHGEGFPEDVDIFEPFVTTQFQGAGLGMAIASEIVQAHGGLIDAQDHPDGGAFVIITIPTAPEHDTFEEDALWPESSSPKMKTTSGTS